MKPIAARPLARPAQHQLPAGMLDLDEGGRRVYVTATERLVAMLNRTRDKWRWVARRRSENRGRPLTEVGEDIVRLHNAGATEAELRPFEYFLRDVIDCCCTGVAQRPLSVLDVEEQELEAQETVLQVIRSALIAAGKPVSPAVLREEADINEREAHVSLEKARALRREAGRVERAHLLQRCGMRVLG